VLVWPSRAGFAVQSTCNLTCLHRCQGTRQGSQVAESRPHPGRPQTSRFRRSAPRGRATTTTPLYHPAWSVPKRTITKPRKPLKKRRKGTGAMAFAPRNPSSHMRQPSMPGSLNASSAAGQSLQARVNEKRAELENLKQLRDLSAAVASQMEALEKKLATLSDGTEGTAHPSLQA